MLYNKKILLGITGGIAAYKCAQLVRLFVKEGADVKVIMTKAAADFVTPQSLSVLSKNEVLIDFFDSDFKWNNHVQLAHWADVFLIAPLTANTLAKMAAGQCDNLLLACYLSARANTVVAPAMDLEMYQHPTVKRNIDVLRKLGNLIIPAEDGELASGLMGEGRMAEPETILNVIKSYFSKSLPLTGKTALVNAGPTYEAIDPVRFIGNRSSGKMGVAVAEALAAQGALVTLVLGPSHEKVSNPSIEIISVESSDEMFEASMEKFKTAHIAVCTAAVADFKPKNVKTQKIKKEKQDFVLDLIGTKDILASLGKEKTNQCLVGFALETENLIENAKLKLEKKNLDMIVANSAIEPGSGFGVDNNKITIIDKHNKILNFELKSKQMAAQDIVNHIISYLSLNKK